MSSSLLRACAIAAVAVALSGMPASAAKDDARVTFLVGKADLHRKGKTIAVRVPLACQSGDTIVVDKESRLELTYPDNSVLRLGEKAKLVLAATPGRKPEPVLMGGKAWANVKKIAQGGNGFGVRTPTAVAAVRGTIFGMSEADSAASVRLYEGAVAVGPGDSLPGQAVESRKKTFGRPSRVGGPKEITLSEFVSLVTGQEILVRRSGQWSLSKFDPARDAVDPWVQFNLKRDAELGLQAPSKATGAASESGKAASPKAVDSDPFRPANPPPAATPTVPATPAEPSAPATTTDSPAAPAP